MSSAKEINDRGKVGHIPRLGPSLGGGRRQENKNNPYINLNKCSMKRTIGRSSTYDGLGLLGSLGSGLMAPRAPQLLSATIKSVPGISQPRS